MIKFKKHLTAISLSCAILVISSFPALAHNYPCDACGIGTVYTNVTSTGWTFVQFVACTHIEGGTDAQYVNVYTSHEECDYCHVTYSPSWSETKTEHYSP